MLSLSVLGRVSFNYTLESLLGLFWPQQLQSIFAFAHLAAPFAQPAAAPAHEKAPEGQTDTAPNTCNEVPVPLGAQSIF